VSLKVKKLLLSLSLVCHAFAGEYAVLQNGFRVWAERHENDGDRIRLYTTSGTLEFPARDVLKFEVEEYIRPTPEPAVPEPSTTEAETELTAEQLISEAAVRHGLRPEFVHSVAAAESAYRLDALSHKGAIGLMQLMPDTAKDLGADPHNPAENADAGARYLKQLLVKYADSPDPVRLALAAYNAGPGAVDRYGSIPPYRETRRYVEKVLRKYLHELKQSGLVRSKT
jgi:soluble lytic murein transglycosylase-like protein